MADAGAAGCLQRSEGSLKKSVLSLPLMDPGEKLCSSGLSNLYLLSLAQVISKHQKEELGATHGSQAGKSLQPCLQALCSLVSPKQGVPYCDTCITRF